MTGSGQRLFVAFAVPEAIAAALVAMQPESAPGIRLSGPKDMHVTLHFLGDVEPETVARELRTVQGQGFTAYLGATGSFRLARGRQVLWVGVEPVPQLLALHAAVARALVATGFEPEARPYLPHITIARLGPAVPQDLARRFTESVPGPDAGSFECRSFGLYASETRPDGARYRLLESWPLEPP